MLNSESLNFIGKKKKCANVLQPIHLKKTVYLLGGACFLLNLFYLPFLPQIQQLVASTNAKQLFTRGTAFCLKSPEISHAKQNITILRNTQFEASYLCLELIFASFLFFVETTLPMTLTAL